MARLVSTDGTHAGFALGHLIDADARLLHGDLEWPLPSDPDAARRMIESRLSRLSGRYLLALLRPSFNRVYLDAAGALATVFCPRRQRVASTPGILAFDERPNPVFSRDPGAFPSGKADQFYPAGLTCDPEMRRVLPNHCLDLARWTTFRHFPTGEIRRAEPAEIPGCIQRIHDAVRRQIEAAVRTHTRVYLTLTAGRDTRMLLACARDFAEHIEFVTLQKPGDKDRKRMDVQIPALLASRLGFRHTVVDARGPVPQEARLAYMRKTGFVLSAGKARDFDLACRKNLDPAGAWLSGFGGEVGRAVYWTKKPPPAGPLTAREMLDRMTIRDRTEFLEPLAAWIAGLPPGDPILHLTLGYIEHRLGGWASPRLYGAPFEMTIFPLCGYEVFETMLRLPPAYQRRNAMATDIIRLAWPDLLDAPFNQDWGIATSSPPRQN